MGNRPSGSNVIFVSETSQCENCGSGSRFMSEGCVHDGRLTSMFPVDEVERKFEELNKGFSKRSPSIWIWLFTIPCIVAGMFCFIGIHDDSMTCTGVTKMCDPSRSNPDFSSCNKIWCCEKGKHSMQRSNTEEVPEKCDVMYSNQSIYEDSSKDDVGTLCAEKKRIPGCNCREERRSKRTKTVCDPIIIQGKKDNFAFIKSNFVLMMLLGQAFCQGGWIIPLLFWLAKKNTQKRFIQELFSDWKNKGVVVEYYQGSKHHAGALYLILPQHVTTTTVVAAAHPVIEATVVQTDMVKG